MSGSNPDKSPTTTDKKTKSVNDDPAQLKSILRKSSTGSQHNDRPPGGGGTFQWDEANIMATYHPADKTYGHMKIDEPKTPYAADPLTGLAIPSSRATTDAAGTGFSPEELAAKLQVAASQPSESSHAAFGGSAADREEDEHQRQFRAKRRAHYNEYLAIKMAREAALNDPSEKGSNVSGRSRRKTHDGKNRNNNGGEGSNSSSEDDDDDPRLKQAEEEAARNAELNAIASRRARREGDSPPPVIHPMPKN